MALSDEVDTTRTGLHKLREEMIAQERERKQREEALIAQVKRVADAYDAQQKKQETFFAALKRSVNQFISAMGW